jgi:hypothetical protein
LFTSLDEALVKNVSIAIYDDQSERIALLAASELLVSLSTLSFFFIVALETLIVFNKDSVLVEEFREGVVSAELG